MDNIEDKLLWAIAGNAPGKVKFLLASGANADYVGCFDETPLIYACRHHDIHPEIITDLLQYGANSNHLEYEGFSPLLLAVTRPNTDTVKILLNAGADASYTLKGKNIIWYALQSSNPKMLPLTLKRTGVNIDAQDTETGYTSLDWSYFHEMNNYVQRLKEYNAQDNTPRHALFTQAH